MRILNPIIGRRNIRLALCLLALLFGTTPLYAQQVVTLEKSDDPKSMSALFIYTPDKDKNTGKAVILCPGGAYSGLAIDHEGHDIAKWLASEGVTGIVLKYRMPHGDSSLPIEDANNAVKIVKGMSDKLGINKGGVGLAGFSAGGHLASTVATHWTDSIERPDFSILFYPVISSRKDCIHAFSFANLLGEKATASDYAEYSNELQVNPSTPPTLLLLSDDDNAVPSMNSVLYYEALKRNGVDAAIYIFPVGGHGWGYKDSFPYKDAWKSLMLSWIKTI